MKQEQEIFEQAMALPSREARDGFLLGACGQNRELRRSVDELLAAFNDAGELDFLKAGDRSQEAQTVLADARIDEGPGTVIGRYKLLQKIGEGGMGAVYMAEQEEPVRRRVALKIIKLGMDTRQVVARFEAERQALALMDHPNIARVLDGGATEAGRPYFVMELVQGVPITEFCDKNKLSAKERMRLFIQVCQAIQSAHQKGIIHRDIKPSNVLVTLHHGEPMPKVIDFGIAKATNQKLTEKTLFTNYATMIGTPAYMSPEQAEMTSMDVDTRTDVYSLGVLLYELLTGSTPFPEKRLRSLGFGEMQRVIVDEEPERPSTRLSTMAKEQKTVVAKNRGEELAALSKLLRGDLDWVVMRCLEKDRRRRYDTPNELVADIERHLKNEPVVARPPTVSYRFQKLVRRNKLAFTAVAAIATVLVLGVIVSTWQAFRATQAKREAVAQRQSADKNAEKARQAEHKAESAATTITRNFYFAEMNLAGQAAAEPGGISRIADLTAKWLPEKGAADQRGWEWYYLRSLLHQDLLTLRGHTNAVQSVAWSPDGKRLASASADNTIKIWDADTSQEVHTLRGHTNVVASISWSPDGKRLASASWDRTIQVWDAASGTNIHILTGHTNGVNSVAWSSDGKRLASASYDKTVKIWGVDGGTNIHTLRGHTFGVNSVSWRPDGKRLASGSDDWKLKIWDTDNGTNIHTLPGHTFPVHSVSWSPDGKRLASSSADHSLKTWDADSGTNILTLSGHLFFALSVTWSPDGKRLASASDDNTVRVWDADSGQPTLTKRGHTNGVNSVAWSPDGKHLASGSADNTVKVWDAASEETLTLLRDTNGVLSGSWSAEGKRFSVSWSPDGKRLASSSWDNTVKVWDTASGTNILTLRGHTNDVLSVAWSPDGKRLASGSWDQKVKVWDAASGTNILTLREHTGRVMSVSWSPNGQRLATASTGGSVRVWDAESGTNLHTLHAHSNWVFAVAWSPDGTRLVSASGDNTLKVWDAALRTNIHTLFGHLSWVDSVSWSPDGQRLASASFDQTVKVWDADSGTNLLTLRGHTATVRSVSWSPNGKRLASASFDKTIKVWDADSGQETLTLRGHTTDVFSVAWSPDGTRLASGSVDNTVKVWDAGRGYALERE